MQNLVRLSKADNLPFAKQTYYKWLHVKRYPTLFVKFGSSVFIDLDEQARLMEAGRLGRREQGASVEANKVQARPRGKGDEK